MTAGVSPSYAGAPPARRSGLARTGMAVFGVAALVVGGILLFNPYAAVRTLALLLGLALVISGCLEIALGWDSRGRASSLVLGAILIIGGLLAAFWPGVTVWTLAVLTGVSLLVHGIGRVVLAFVGRAEVPGWGWLALAGAFNVLVGILALAWPAATVVVLSLILAFQVLTFGVCLLVAAFLPSGSRTSAPA
ncbi:DUF308 domain-containing protein [Blastococcus sp. CT_GayMR20]|uniref:HdeD family acid-resistance protein n=1 Tax=Blastococcus sp. CT_GayMR20 TaxID=2559609 RepID=UPI0014311BAB|nr:DUF308 domain-containing protein [Blastococcus sp. CT_GayMR20]